jgi:lipopolysaccharide/colanic/teichoic acid biosynthesis glycosyltransferase
MTMINDNGVSIFINVAAVITILGGSIFAIGLVSKSFLNTIFEHVDRLVEDIGSDEYAHLSDLPKPPELGVDYILLKRVMDIIFSIVVILIMFPVMLIIAIAIKISSPGPILFRAQRIGQDGRKFHAYKFRTLLSYMVEESLSTNTAPVNGNDPRVTGIGKFLRASSLDELPKVFNVLFGHMSIVGTSVATDHEYLEVLSNSGVQQVLLKAKPGLVSLWALSGSRWRFEFNKRILLDLYYVSHQSFSLDIAIFVMTVPSVYGRTAAY